MKVRVAPPQCTSLPLLLTAACTLLVTPVALAKDGASSIPRRADGHPDLSGTYDVATLTPLVRPARFGDTLTLSAEEAKAITDHWLSSLDQDYQPSDPNREAPPEGGVDFYVSEFNGAAGNVGGYNAFFVDIGDSVFQIDGKYRTSILTSPANGQMPPLTEDGKRRAAEAASDRRPNHGEAWWADQQSGPYDDPEVRPLGERCILGFGSTSGPPSLPVMYNNNKRIVQTDDAVVILVEMNHDARVIRLGGEHAPPEIRKWMGDSVGHWEGDTLVVDTTNFLDHSGYAMASRDLHVVERFTRVDENTLVYQFTVDDPTTWTQPWGGEYPWPATSNRIYEYACHEGNYALGGILRGARVLEADALAVQAATDSATDPEN